MALQVRPITTEEVPDFLQCLGIAFLEQTTVSEESAAWWEQRLDLTRCLGAFVDGSLAGTAGAFSAEITAPGGIVAAAAQTQVTVLPNRRRQGLLRAMMRAQLESAREREEPLAILLAAEWPIYGRFGFGPATESTGLVVDTQGARFIESATGSVELVSRSELRALAPTVYERCRLHLVGALSRSDVWWDVITEIDPRPGASPSERGVVAVWIDRSGEVRGYVSYDAQNRYEDGVAKGLLAINELMAETPEARRELWRFLCGIDLAVEARIDPSPVDDPLHHQLVDGRCVRQRGRSDHLWVRILDVPSALQARRYAVSAVLVMAVHDRQLGRGGHFVLEGAPHGASVQSTSAEPDIELDVAALGAAYLGGTSFSALAASGLVRVAATPTFSWPTPCSWSIRHRS